MTAQKINKWLMYSLFAAIGILPILISIYAHLHQSHKIKVAFVTNCAVDFWAIAKKGTEEAAKKFDVDVEFYMPAYVTAAEQHRIIEDLIVKGVKGIAVSPLDASNQTSVLNRIIPDNIYFITQDSDLKKGSKRLCYIGTDNTKAGWAVGQLVKEQIPDGGKIMIYVGKLDILNAQERRQGVIAALADLPETDSHSERAREIASHPYPINLGKYQILGTMTDQADKDKCYANVIDTLIKHPDVKALVGLYCYNPPEMILGVKKFKKEGSIKLVGFDEDEMALQGIKRGDLYGTVVQNPYMFGYEAVHILQHLIRHNGQLPTDLPKEVTTTSKDGTCSYFVDRRVIKKQNNGGLFDMEVDSFMEDLRHKKGKR